MKKRKCDEEEEKEKERNEENAKELDELGSSNASKGLRVCFECKQLTEHIAAHCPQRLADGIVKAAAAEKVKNTERHYKTSGTQYFNQRTPKWKNNHNIGR